MRQGKAVSELHSHLGFWLRMVSNAVSHRFARKLEARGITVAEWVFLRVLYDGAPVAPSVLAERMGMTKGAITKLADRLAAKGLVARAVSTHSGSRQTLSLTAEGRAMVPALAKIADENDATFFAVLEPAERRCLAQVLTKIASEHGLTKAPTD